MKQAGKQAIVQTWACLLVPMFACLLDCLFGEA
jgi:hypothetical protein